jgi:hypothetical protein
MLNATYTPTSGQRFVTLDEALPLIKQADRLKIKTPGGQVHGILSIEVRDGEVILTMTN